MCWRRMSWPLTHGERPGPHSTQVIPPKRRAFFCGSPSGGREVRCKSHQAEEG